jgi:predicted DNA-binding protein YlxM (UPF0122 family)
MKLHDNKEWLRQRYVVQKLSLHEIAKEAGCSHQTIQNRLEKFGFIFNPRAKWSGRK